MSPTLSFTIDLILSGADGSRAGEQDKLTTDQSSQQTSISKYIRDMFLNKFLLTHTPPLSHKWYHPNIESAIISEEQLSPLCLLLSKWGPSPLIPLPLHSGRAPHSPCNCVPRTLVVLSPHCLCAEHTWGRGEGGRLKVKPVLGTLLQSPAWMLTMYTEKTAWQS